MLKPGEDRLGTAPVRDAYFALASTALIGQLERVDGFINKAQYPNQIGTMSSEWGSIGNCRFHLSSGGSVTRAGSLLGNDIYNIFIGGQESYGQIKQSTQTAKFIYHGPGHGKNVAVYKSSLIELELSAHNGGDNNAQAEQYAFAA